MYNWFLESELWLYNKFGFNFVVHLEDFLLSFASFFLGSLVTGILCGNVILKIQKVPVTSDHNKFNKVKWVILDDNQSTFVVSPENMGEAVETALVIIFKPFFTIKHYGVRDERRTKIFIACYLILGFILTLFAYLSATTVFDPPR